MRALPMKNRRKIHHFVKCHRKAVRCSVSGCVNYKRHVLGHLIRDNGTGEGPTRYYFKTCQKAKCPVCKLVHGRTNDLKDEPEIPKEFENVLTDFCQCHGFQYKRK